MEPVGASWLKPEDVILLGGTLVSTLIMCFVVRRVMKNEKSDA